MRGEVKNESTLHRCAMTISSLLGGGDITFKHWNEPFQPTERISLGTDFLKLIEDIEEHADEQGHQPKGDWKFQYPLRLFTAYQHMLTQS